MAVMSVVWSGGCRCAVRRADASGSKQPQPATWPDARRAVRAGAAHGVSAAAAQPSTLWAVVRSGLPLVPERECHRSAELEVAAAVGVAVALWAEGDDAYAHQTVVRMGEIADRFARRLAANGITKLCEVTTADCEAFIEAVGRSGSHVSVSTSRFRRTTLRALFRTLRLHDVDAPDLTLDIVLAPRPKQAARPLTADEVVFCRTVVKAPRAWDHRRPAAWALAEAGAVTSEQAMVCVDDLDDPRCPRQVALPGTRRARPRVVTLTDWGRRVLATRLAELDPLGPETLLVYGGRRAADSAAAQAATCNLVGNVLRDAGLAADPCVRPASVRHWRAAVEFDATGRIEDVANLLGHRSLDEAAEAIGWRWEEA